MVFRRLFSEFSQFSHGTLCSNIPQLCILLHRLRLVWLRVRRHGLPCRKPSGMKASLKISFLPSSTPSDLDTAEMIATVVDAEEPSPAAMGISQSTFRSTPCVGLSIRSSVA